MTQDTTQAPDRPMTRLMRYLGNYKKSVTFSVASSVANKIFDLMPPFLTAWIIDTAAGQTPSWIGSRTGISDAWSVIIFLIILTVIIFSLESLFEWWLKKGFMRLAQRVQHDLRMDTYRHLQRRELAFFEEQRTGNLMSILNDDINQLERFLNGSFNEIIQLITLFAFAGWALCSVSLELGLIGMVPVPLIILGSIYYQRKIAPFYKEVRQTVGDMGNRLENNISGMLVVKSFTAEHFEEQRVENVSATYRDANFKAIGLSSLFVPLIRILITIGFASTLMIGAYWVINGMNGFTLGGLAFFAMMIQRLLWPVTRMGAVFDEFERARASARRVFGLIDSEPAIQSPTEAVPFPDKIGSIELKKLDFHYHPDQPILRQLDLSIREGQTIGIAGPTGAGKTTLIKLLLRLYDVTGGSIQMGGHDLRRFNVQELRRRIALVSQDVYLFHGTIRENIAYGRPESTEEAIIAAAQKAQLHDFIAALPEGYDSIVGERGIKLSGGQRQRLSIARAILKDAPVLILDEATSAVDTETERAIQENLEQLTKGKTALIIAHRLSTIRHADQIIVLEHGMLTEQGTHEELLEHNGIYADLWKVQIGELDVVS
jgi:ATP-binding cassette subfamily B protein